MDCRYRLVDLGRIRDAELSGEPVLRAGFLALKYSTRPARQAGALVDMLGAIKATRDERVPLLLYVAQTWKAIEPRTFERFREQVGLEGPMTTIADQLRREGEKRGERKGRRHGKVDLLAGLLRERFGAVPESRSSQLASASEADLDRWAIRLIRAHDLDSVFE